MRRTDTIIAVLLMGGTFIGCGKTAAPIGGAYFFTGTAQSITTSHALATSSCPGGTTAVAGGCNCGPSGGGIDAALLSGSGFACACDSYDFSASPQATSVCANEEITVTKAVTTIGAADSLATATCPAGTLLVAGGVTCGTALTSTITSSYPSSTSSWSAQCDNIGTSPAVYAHCLAVTNSALSGKSISIKSASFSTSGSIQCDGGKTMISGGCSCALNAELNESYTSDLSTWNCSCSTGSGTAHALCYG